jgi:Icc-related predicted phosphoesterase
MDVLQFSDIHIVNENDTGKLEAILAYCTKVKPKAVSIVGDLIEGRSLQERIQKINGSISKDENQYIQLKNHINAIHEAFGKATGEQKEKLNSMIAEYERLNALFSGKDIEGKINAIVSTFHTGEAKIVQTIDGIFGKIKQSGSEVIGVLGNHDPVDSHERYKNITWLDKGQGVEIEGIQFEGATNLIGGVIPGYEENMSPHLSLEKGQTDYKRIKESVKGKKNKIFLLHNPNKMSAEHIGYFNSPDIEKLVKEEKPKAIFAGHTHQEAIIETDGVLNFVSTDMLGYRHVLDASGEVKESYRLWLVGVESYQKNKKALDKEYKVYAQ